MMFIYISSKQWINAVSLCSLLAVSLPSGATVVTKPGPPPKTKIVTTTTNVGGKWVTVVDPDGVTAFNLDVEYDPSRMALDVNTPVGGNGVDVLYPYLQDGSFTIDTTGPGTNSTTAFIRNIAGHLVPGYSPMPDIFTITFIDLLPRSGSSAFRTFANTSTSYIDVVSYTTSVSDGTVTRIWSADITEAVSYADAPEPSAVALFAVGFASVSAYRVSRRKKQTA